MAWSITAWFTSTDPLKAVVDVVKVDERQADTSRQNLRPRQLDCSSSLVDEFEVVEPPTVEQQHKVDEAAVIVGLD